MGEDICSEAGTAMLSFIGGKGDFEVNDSKIVIRITEGMNWEKISELGDIVGELRPKRFSVSYMDGGFGIEALEPSLQTLEDLLAKLVER